MGGGTYFDLLGLHVKIYKKSKDSDWLSSSDSEGVIVAEVKRNSIAEENNIHRGDIIIELGKTSIKDVTDYQAELERYKKGDTIMLRILRNGSPLYIAFEIE